MSSLTDHFTRAELLAAAEAADAYLPGHRSGWGLTVDGREVSWRQIPKTQIAYP